MTPNPDDQSTPLEVPTLHQVVRTPHPEVHACQPKVHTAKEEIHSTQSTLRTQSQQEQYPRVYLEART
ncbi:hypothetical protein FRX31_005525, partial [Thalictrum thalictroides]